MEEDMIVTFKQGSDEVKVTLKMGERITDVHLEVLNGCESGNYVMGIATLFLNTLRNV